MISLFQNIYNNIFIIIIVKIYLFSNLAFANFIRDTEIESILNKWSTPIFEAAGIPADSIKINLIAEEHPQQRYCNYSWGVGGCNIFD